MARSPRLIGTAACTLLLSAWLPVAAASQASLGRIDFPTSGSAAAQPAFIRGVLLMHSFEYGDALQAFREAQRLDPGFAMAYWGEAMTYTHAVWNEQDLAAARAALARLAPTPDARRAKAKTPREQAYLEAVEILYGDGPKARRDTLYSNAMERLTRAFPEDDEAKAFYALSLLGLGEGERDVWSYVRAAAAAQAVFEHNPDHPGAAHYIIHSFDDPTHAPLGLKAARAYSRIAPDAAHAQHMTSHIFVALGMWDDVVAANEQATTVEARHAGRSPLGCRHYHEWLEYGYLQQGRPHEAARLVRECQWDAERLRGAPGSLERMRAIYLVDTRDWEGPIAMLTRDTATVPDGAKSVRDFADALRAIRRGDRPTAQILLDRMASRRERLKGYETGNVGVMEHMLRAEFALADTRGDEALAEVDRAVRLEESLPFEYGPPATYKPPLELKGEILLSLDRWGEAVRAFDQALRRTPERALTLLGLARASSRSNDSNRAVAAYRQLKAIWHRAEPGFAEVAEADRYLSQHVSERP
jgi:tetratricopeptide (TPR) repeat protein